MTSVTKSQEKGIEWGMYVCGGSFKTIHIESCGFS